MSDNSNSEQEEGESEDEKESINIEEEVKAVEKTNIPVPEKNDEGKHCFLVNPYFVLGYFSSIKLSEMPLAE